MGLFSNKEEEVRRKRNLKELEDKRVRFAERLAAEGFRPEHCLFVQRDGGFVAVARHGGGAVFPHRPRARRRGGTLPCAASAAPAPMRKTYSSNLKGWAASSALARRAATASG